MSRQDDFEKFEQKFSDLVTEQEDPDLIYQLQMLLNQHQNICNEYGICATLD